MAENEEEKEERNLEETKEFSGKQDDASKDEPSIQGRNRIVTNDFLEQTASSIVGDVCKGDSDTENSRLH